MQTDKDIIRTRQKMTASFRAQLRLKQRFESIDFELDVLKPKLEELEDGLVLGQLPEFIIEDEPRVKKNENHK